MKHRFSAAAAIVAALMVVAGCTPSLEQLAASQNPYPASSPLHAPVDRMLRKLATDPRYLELAREAVKAGDNLQDRNIKLSAAGLRALDDDALQTQIRIMARILGQADDETCALLAFPHPGTELATGKRLLGELEKLPQDEIDAWFDLSYQATVAGLANKPAYPATPLMAEVGMKQLTDGLSEDSKHRMRAALANGSSDEQRCWAARLMFNRTLKLPEKERAAVVRSLVAPTGKG